MKKTALLIAFASVISVGCGGTNPSKDTSNHISISATSDIAIRAGEVASLSATAVSAPAAISNMTWTTSSSSGTNINVSNGTCVQRNVNTNNSSTDPSSTWTCPIQVTAPSTIANDTIYRLTVSVTDAKGNISSRDVNVTVKPNASQPAVVSIASDPTVDASKSLEVACAAQGGNVNTSGRYVYQYVITDNGGLPSLRINQNPTAPSLATLNAPAVLTPTKVVIACRATDDALKTGVASKTITINPIPNPTLIAAIDDLVTFAPGATSNLDGSLSIWFSSSVGTLSPQPPIYYYWTQSQGSPVQIINPTSARPTVIFPLKSSVDGSRRETYSFTLTVSDQPFVNGVTTGITNKATGVYFVNYVTPISITVPTISPFKSNTLATAQVISSGQAGQPLYYAWTQVDGPEVSLAGWNTPTVSFIAPTVTGMNKAVVLRVAIDYVPITPGSTSLYYTDVIIPITP